MSQSDRPDVPPPEPSLVFIADVLEAVVSPPPGAAVLADRMRYLAELSARAGQADPGYRAYIRAFGCLSQRRPTDTSEVVARREVYRVAGLAMLDFDTEAQRGPVAVSAVEHWSAALVIVSHWVLWLRTYADRQDLGAQQIARQLHLELNELISF